MYNLNLFLHYMCCPMCCWGREKGDSDEPEDHAIGRSIGGLSSKIHILCDCDGHPLHFHLTAGQTHESIVSDTRPARRDSDLGELPAQKAVNVDGYSNRVGFGIVDDEVIQEAAHQEIIRRYFRCACEYAMGFVEREILERSKLIMENASAKVEDRTTVRQEESLKVAGPHGVFPCGLNDRSRMS